MPEFWAEFSPDFSSRILSVIYWSHIFIRCCFRCNCGYTIKILARIFLWILPRIIPRILPRIIPRILVWIQDKILTVWHELLGKPHNMKRLDQTSDQKEEGIFKPYFFFEFSENSRESFSTKCILYIISKGQLDWFKIVGESRTQKI